ncbi:tigger transposable element-derived protein 6-like [Ixodes scapularis]
MDEPPSPLERLKIVKDDLTSTEKESVFRANLNNEAAVEEWLEAYSLQTNTSWIVRKVQKEGTTVWRCQHHPRNKVSERRNAARMARLDVKIKKLSKGSKQNDPYLRRDVPLATVIRMDIQHLHSTQSADALRLLWGTRTVRQTFMGYFSDGMAVSEARRLHESKLCMEENGPELLANGALNRLARTVQHWHTVWRSACFGGGPIDALSKLEEKAPLYASMLLEALKAARDIVFIDSTSLCDTTKCTVTVVLVATMAGAVPLTVLLHNEHSTEGYSAAFKLLSGTDPLCFGGLSAADFALRLEHDDFAASEGWFHRFRERHDLVFRAVSGEGQDTNMETCATWKSGALQDYLRSYSPRDIFNADETALFFKLLPNKTITYKGDNCAGGKRSKERVTVMLAANMMGTEKLPIFVIGKSAKPRCFKNIRSLPTDYAANKKAWMTGALFEQWLRKLDKKFELRNRQVLLLVDNCSAHNVDIELKAIQLAFLLPNTTSMLQPMDQGVIKNMKTFYRRHLLERMILCSGNESPYNITLLTAMHMLMHAWDQVKEDRNTMLAMDKCFPNTSFQADNVVNRGAARSEAALIPIKHALCL